MDGITSFILILGILPKPNDILHVDPICIAACLDKGPIKGVAIVGDKDDRADEEDVGEEAIEGGTFIHLIVCNELSRIFCLWSVLETINVLTDYRSVYDQVSLDNK